MYGTNNSGILKIYRPVLNNNYIQKSYLLLQLIILSHFNKLYEILLSFEYTMAFQTTELFYNW